MRLRKRFIVPIVMVVALCVVGVVAYLRVHPRSYHDVQEQHLLKVVTEYNALSFAVNETDTSGFQYEILRAFADSLQLDLTFTIEPDLHKNIEGLNSGKYDVIMKLLPNTTELKDIVTFSTPITTDYLVLVQRRPSKKDSYKLLHNVAELDGKTICVPSGSPNILILNHIQDELGIDFSIEEIADVDSEHLLAMLSNDKIEFAALDYAEARSVRKSYPNIDYEVRLGFAQDMSWAFNEDATYLQTIFDDWFINFKQTKSFSKLYNKYFK